MSTKVRRFLETWSLLFWRPKVRLPPSLSENKYLWLSLATETAVNAGYITCPAGEQLEINVLCTVNEMTHTTSSGLSWRDPFNENFWKFRSKTEWIGSVQPERFRKNRSTFRGGQLFSIGPVRSKWTVPTHSPEWTILTHSQSLYLAVRYFPCTRWRENSFGC